MSPSEGPKQQQGPGPLHGTQGLTPITARLRDEALSRAAISLPTHMGARADCARNAWETLWEPPDELVSPWSPRSYSSRWQVGIRVCEHLGAQCKSQVRPF